jgi:hypothetical protein
MLTHDPVTATVEIIQRHLRLVRVRQKSTPAVFRDDFEGDRLIGLLLAARDRAEAARLLDRTQRDQALRFIAAALPAARFTQPADNDEAA